MFKRQYFVIILAMMFSSNQIYAKNLIGVDFYSYGIYKTEQFSFVNDSICVYIQNWDSTVLEGKSQFVDTFVYHNLGHIDNPKEKIERVVIKSVTLSKNYKPLASPIENSFFQMLQVKLPKAIVFTDKEEHSVITGLSRRSRYNLWDVPYYKGAYLSCPYATLYNIDTDTLWIYSGHIVRFNSNDLLLYTQEALDSNIEDDIGPIANSLLTLEKVCYEYQKYCYQTGKMVIQPLDKEMIIGKMFEYSFFDAEELLYFINDTSCLYRKGNNDNYCFYKTYNNLIIIEMYDDMDLRHIVDTLAYSNNYIFYAKTEVIGNGSYSPNISLFIKAFREKKDTNALVKENKLKDTFSRKKKCKWIEQTDTNFNATCFKTYIPINFSGIK